MSGLVALGSNKETQFKSINPVILGVVLVEIPQVCRAKFMLKSPLTNEQGSFMLSARESEIHSHGKRESQRSNRGFQA